MSTLVTVRDSLGQQLWRLGLAWRHKLLHRQRYRQLVLEQIEGISLLVLPDVFNPKLLRSGEFLVQHVSTSSVVRPGARVLDLGTGSGAGAIAAARRGCQIVAVDINPEAVRCARINALLNRVDGQIDTRQGDLFDPVGDQRFDLVLFNPPYYRGIPRDWLDHAWRAPDVIERFAAGLRAHLARDGRALLVLSSDGEHQAFLAELNQRQFDACVQAERDFGNERMWIYQVASAC